VKQTDNIKNGEFAPEEDNFEIAAVIAAALAGYGYQPHQIVAIRPAARFAGGEFWAKAARLEMVNKW
jgi:hypothetical protein